MNLRQTLASVGTWKKLLWGSAIGVSAVGLLADNRVLVHSAESVGWLPRVLTTSELNRVDTLPYLRRITRQKLKSYRAYNDLDIRDDHAAFLANFRFHFARASLSEDSSQRDTFLRSYHRELERFTLELCLRSQSVAGKIIREADVSQIAGEMTPFSVNDFEDIKFFPNLPKKDQVDVQGYDLDAFRDFGLHWFTIQSVIHRPWSGLTKDFDPFAAELLAEVVAQYGVLVARLAGSVTAEAGMRMELETTDLHQASKRIEARAKTHRSAVREKREVKPIASSAQGSTRSTQFLDVAQEMGLDFVHRSADWLSRARRRRLHARNELLIDSQGSGLAVADINGDNFPDLLLLSGSGNRLFINEAGKHFRDITESSGLKDLGRDGLPPEPRQALIADLDNDGYQDIFISYVNERYRLYKGGADLRFEEVTRDAGLDAGLGVSGGPIVVFDYDNDGRLDLYLGFFGNFAAGQIPFRGRDSMDDKNTQAPPNRLFRNLGDMHFKDVTVETNLADPRWALALTHTDLNNDGFQDIVIANDFGFNSFYVNDGHGRFENRVKELGADFFGHGMCATVGELNGDDFPEIYVTNVGRILKDDKYVRPHSKTFVKLNVNSLENMRIREADSLFMSASENAQLVKYVLSEDVVRSGESTAWAWGSTFFDFDLDGDDDIYVVNGGNIAFQWRRSFNPEQARRIKGRFFFNLKNVLFENDGGKMRNIGQEAHANIEVDARSVAQLDFDADGDPDLILNNFEEPARLLRNNTPGNNNWLKVRLVGDPTKKTNRDAIGARVIATTASGLRIWREVRGGGGYLSMESKTLHFGLGDEELATLAIRWPNGDEQVVEDARAGQLHIFKHSDM